MVWLNRIINVKFDWQTELVSLEPFQSKQFTQMFFYYDDYGKISHKKKVQRDLIKCELNRVWLNRVNQTIYRSRNDSFESLRYSFLHHYLNYWTWFPSSSFKRVKNFLSNSFILFENDFLILLQINCWIVFHQIYTSHVLEIFFSRFFSSTESQDVRPYFNLIFEHHFWL